MCRLVVLAGLLFCSPAHAQEKPDAPKPKHDRKVFIVGTALLAASKTADAITTRQLLDRGGWENNSVFGLHPSPAKQSLINLGFFAAQSGVFYLTEHNRHAWVRWAGFEQGARPTTELRLEAEDNFCKGTARAFG